MGKTQQGINTGKLKLAKRKNRSGQYLKRGHIKKF